MARRFALCIAAGLLARDRAGILPESMDAGMSVTACFRSWLEERGGAGASEDAAILAQVRLFLEQHGVSRFQDMDTEQTHGVSNRVGFRRKAGDTTEFLILLESFRAEVVKGFSPRRAAAVLRKEGWLRMNDGKSSAVCTLPGMGQRRVYAVALPDERGTD